jgi:hypothetical protein
MTKATRKWTIVQHSGYGYAGKPGFERAVETRQVPTLAEQKKVEKVGGILFESYSQAEAFAEKANHPKGHTDIYPGVQGSFAATSVDELRVYIPVREVTG